MMAIEPGDGLLSGTADEAREISRRMVAARQRRVCDNSVGSTRHFIEPGDRYERIVMVRGHFVVYARCEACAAGWDGYSRYPGSPELHHAAARGTEAASDGEARHA